jgi:hypothetical protein
MAESQSNGRFASDNPQSFAQFILELAEAGVAVETRPEIGAIEVVVSDHGEVAEVVLLAPEQALALARRLIAAVQALAAAEGANK